MATPRAEEQAQAQLEGIQELVVTLIAAEGSGDDDKLESALEAIREDPLSVAIRSDWTVPGYTLEPAEYLILLCTGGPAVRIIGELSQYNEAETATLEYQDWFTPWVELVLTEEEEIALLRYAQQFYYS